MKIVLELDDKIIKQYAKFLGCPDDICNDSSKLAEYDYMKGRLEDDIYFVIDAALHP